MQGPRASARQRRSSSSRLRWEPARANRPGDRVAPDRSGSRRRRVPAKSAAASAAALPGRASGSEDWGKAGGKTVKVLERLGCGHLAQALVIGFFGRSGSRSHLGLLQCGLDFEYSVCCAPMPASLGVVLMIMITIIISTRLIKTT